MRGRRGLRGRGEACYPVLMKRGSGEPTNDAGVLLLRASYLQARRSLGPLAGADVATHGPQVHRLRVLLATLGAWLERADAGWLAELRDLEVTLHRAEVTGSAGLSEVRARWQAHEAATLRAADAATFAWRGVDLVGASALVGLDAGALRTAIAAGELRASEDAGGVVIGLDALAAFARGRGLAWADGLADDAAARQREVELRALIGG